MRKPLTVLLLLLFFPTLGLADRGYGPSPVPYPRGGPSPHGYDVPIRGYPSGERHHHHHDNDWIVPLAIFGGVLGIAALSQMQPASPPPAPPRRLCRDTYNYYDEYGNYLYSRYIDRPCDN